MYNVAYHPDARQAQTRTKKDRRFCEATVCFFSWSTLTGYLYKHKMGSFCMLRDLQVPNMVHLAIHMHMVSSRVDQYRVVQSMNYWMLLETMNM